MESKTLSILDRDADFRFYRPNAIEMRINGRWRCIGKMLNGEFVKFEGRHGLYKELNAFGLPHSFLLWLKKKNIRFIKVIYEGIHYRTTADKWLGEGIYRYYKGRAEKRQYLPRRSFT